MHASIARLLRRHLPASGALGLIAVFTVTLAPATSPAAPFKSWSGTIAVVTATDPMNGVTAGFTEPMDPSSPLNGTFSTAVDVSNYDDGHYQVKVRTDALVSSVSPPRWKVDVQVGNLIKRITEFGAPQAWTLTTCIPKDARWLRLAEYGYFGFQQNVKWWVDVVARNTTACP